MQLKLSFYDWCISILSSKKSYANHLSGPLRKRVQKLIVCLLWILIRFVSFCVSRFVACDLIVTKT